jgi:hypothetical protein
MALSGVLLSGTHPLVLMPGSPFKTGWDGRRWLFLFKGRMSIR